VESIKQEIGFEEKFFLAMDAGAELTTRKLALFANPCN